MIFTEPTIAGCYLFVLSVFFISFVRIFMVRRQQKRRLRQLSAGKE